MQIYLLVAMLLYSISGIALSVPTEVAAMDRPSKGGTLDYSSCEKPIWPKGALENKKAGTVSLALLIGVDGKVMQSKLLKSSGFSDLDDAARDGISKCSFVPGLMNGRPTQGWILFKYVWE